MSTKLTLTLDEGVIRIAKEYAKEQNTSLSRMVEGYFRRITEEAAEPAIKMDIAPITKKLTGIVRLSQEALEKSDKELLVDALKEKYL
ncbi:MAG: hypothetical protein JEZ04_00855 [Spirochaetales bacterium]|nr:hypothetical protein [Spirochaetales bacterium]